jgi:hypothetical protein
VLCGPHIVPRYWCCLSRRFADASAVFVIGAQEDEFPARPPVEPQPQSPGVIFRLPNMTPGRETFLNLGSAPDRGGSCYFPEEKR